MTADSTVTAESGKRVIRRALVSVYDKTGLEELARGLHEAGVELVVLSDEQETYDKMR